MLDAGCGIDLIGMHDLTGEERKLISAYQELLLRTANGKTSTKGLARLKIDGLTELVEAYMCLKILLRCCPLGRDAWSMGAGSHGTRVQSRISLIRVVVRLNWS